MELIDELGRAVDPGVLTEAEHPGNDLTGVGVGGDKQPIALVLAGAHLAVAAEMALDLPGDPCADPHLGAADRFAELPVDPVGVRPRIELGGALEVVLGLGRVADLAPDAGQPEDPNRVALMGAPDDVELAALEQQLVRVDLAAPELVALHRVVVEDDRLAAEDRGLDLGETLRDVVAAGRAGDPEGNRALLGRAERAGAAPGDLLERQPQRLGVRELAVEQLQGRCAAPRARRRRTRSAGGGSSPAGASSSPARRGRPPASRPIARSRAPPARSGRRRTAARTRPRS